MQASEWEAEASEVGVDLELAGETLRYACSLENLLPDLSSVFVPSTLDEAGRQFLERASAQPISSWRSRAHRFLTVFLSDFDANGLLGMYPLFLQSRAQFARLLGPSAKRALLDVGAGAGYVTAQLAPLVSRVACTETSFFMARKLRAKGYECWNADLSQNGPRRHRALAEQHDLVALLNVIDRCSAPRSLLRVLVEHLQRGGQLLLSSPLPYRAFYYDGGLTRHPRETLEVTSDTWEAALNELWSHELAPLGLRALALTRAPYLSAGDAQRAWYALDSAILVCERV